MQHDNSLPKPKPTPTNLTAFKRLTKELTKTVIVCCIFSKATKENLAELCNYYIRFEPMKLVGWYNQWVFWSNGQCSNSIKILKFEDFWKLRNVLRWMNYFSVEFLSKILWNGNPCCWLISTTASGQYFLKYHAEIANVSKKS